MFEIKISMQDLMQILHGNLTYWLLDKIWPKPIPTQDCLFIAYDKQNKQTYAVIKTLMTPAKLANKYIVSLHKQFGFHQDIAWLKQDQKHNDLRLCLPDGNIVFKNKQGQICYESVWD